ncbi:MAG: ABC transporter permease, partial [Gaiellaceae bacterium]
RFNPLALEAGRWAVGADEVVIDAGTAHGEGFAVGDRIEVAASGPVHAYELVGVARFGDVDSIGDATFAVFDLATAQRLYDKRGRFNAISVAAKEGVSADQLMGRIAPLLPETAQVRSGEAQAAPDGADVGEFLTYIQYGLLAFGGIALFVGGFVIFNTISITVAQRTRELATLRTLGASRRQVLRSVMLESLALGAVASLAGLGLGLALAVGLNALLVAFGLDLPTAATVLAPRTVVVSLVVGTAITVLAGLFPAIRATRVPPIAAVREGAQVTRQRARSAFAGGAFLALGVGLMSYSLFVASGAAPILLGLIVGGVAVFVGVALVASRLVKSIAAVVGLPASRLGGAAGRLAR